MEVNFNALTEVENQVLSIRVEERVVSTFEEIEVTEYKMSTSDRGEPHAD